MANSFKRAMALTLAAAMVATAVPATNFGTISADAASYKITGTTTPIKSNTYQYKLSGVKKGMKVKVKVTGTGKSKVAIKSAGLKGASKKVVASKKYDVTKNTPVLKVTPKAAAGKNYKITVTVFSKKGKKLKAISKKATIYAQTKSVTITANTAGAVSASSITATGATIAAGTTLQLSAAKTPAKNTIPVTWKTSDAKVANVDKSSGLVTGVGAGTATITATSGNASASYVVTVEAGEVVAKLTDVKQISANSADLTFDNDASKVEKNEIIISRLDNGKAVETIQVDKLKLSEDKKTARVTLAAPFVDKGNYEVSYRESKVAFAASVGEVASVVITTVNAEQNKETPINFELRDANGIDVTSTVKVDNGFVRVDVDGSVADTSRPSKATITMSNVGDKAEVTVTYNKNGATKTEDIVGKGTITCIDRKAVVGTPLFAQTDKINDKSKCAKFYLGLSDAEASVAVDQTLNDLYFCAKDEEGDPISYETYEVTSSNENILNVSNPDHASGKYTQITITGMKEGTANINVSASVGGKATSYIIPVKVTKTAEASQLTVSVTRPTVSNAYDEDYFGKVEYKVKDAAGKEVGSDKYTEVKVDYARTDIDYSSNDYLADKGKYKSHIPSGEKGFLLDGVEYTAYGAKTGQYPIKVTLTKLDGKTIERTINVSVNALPVAAYNEYINSVDNTGNVKPASVTYAIELGSNKLDSSKNKKDESWTMAKVYAVIDNKFAGYVRTYNDGRDTYFGDLPASKQGSNPVATGDGVSFKLEMDDKTDSYNDDEIIIQQVTDKAIEVEDKTIVTAKGDTVGAIRFIEENADPSVATIGTISLAVNVDDSEKINDLELRYINEADEDAVAKAVISKTGDTRTLTITARDEGGEDKPLTIGDVESALSSLTSAGTMSADDEDDQYIFDVIKNNVAVGGNNNGANVIDAGDIKKFQNGKNNNVVVDADFDEDNYVITYRGSITLGAVSQAAVAGDLTKDFDEAGIVWVDEAFEIDESYNEVVCKFATMDITYPYGWQDESLLIKYSGVVSEDAITVALEEYYDDDLSYTGKLPQGDTTLVWKGGLTPSYAENWAAIKNDDIIFYPYLGVKLGSKESYTGNLFNYDAEAAAITKGSVLFDEFVVGDTSLELDTRSNRDGQYFVSANGKYDRDFARSGNYTIFLTYISNKDGKEYTKTTGLTVTNTFTMPKVTVKSHNVDTLSFGDIAKALSANVDMNNDESSHDSILSDTMFTSTSKAPTAGYAFDEASTSSSNSITIQYVIVEEDGVDFYCPVGQTFKTE